VTIIGVIRNLDRTLMKVRWSAGGDGKLDFIEDIYNRDDPTCCPTGGKISGNLKIIEDARQSPPVWKIVVATTKRIPPVSSVQQSHKVVIGTERH
jgi:hypothetical protein